MQTILKHCTAVLSRMIFIGFGVQIVLGILWMCNAFAGFTKPGEGIVCVGGMLLVGAAVLFMKRSICKESALWTDVFTVLSVITFPFVMQCFVNADIRVPLTAALLFGMGGVCRMLRNKKGIKVICMVLSFWLIAGGLIVGADTFRQGWTPVSTRLTERIVWSNLYNSYEKLPKKIRGKLKYYKMVEGTYEATGIRELVVPFLEKKLGEQETREVLRSFCAVAWEHEKKSIIKEVIWDAAGYTVSPLVVPLQLSGRAYDSYSGTNYRELLQPAPELGKFYADYSCWWFAVALVGAAMVYVLRLLKEKRKPAMRQWIIVALTGLGMIICFTLDGAGRMDYKNTLFVLCIWLIWMAGGVQDEKG